MIPQQTTEQRERALRDAGLSPAQQEGVRSGTGYTPSNPSLSYYSPTGGAMATPPAPVNRPIYTPTPTPNSVSGANTTSVSSSGGSGIETEAEKQAREYLDTSFQKPKTEEELIAEKTERAKSLIQSKKDYYQSLLGEQAGINDVRTRETNARAVLNGLSGSSEASTMVTETADKNSKANAKIRAEQNVALEEIYYNIQNSAKEEARQMREDATKSATDILTRKENSKTKAVAEVSTLAKSGFDFESIKTNDPETYNYLAQSVGGEAQLKALAVLNRPQESILDKRVEGGKYIISYQNPLTGKVRIESVDLGVPPEYTKSIDLGDKIMLVPDNFDPTKDKPIYIPKGVSPKSPSNETLSEKKTKVIDEYTSAFTPGTTLDDGTPIIDKNGFANPVPWKEAIKEAPTRGLSRIDFIKAFGYLLYTENGKISPEYGLTPQEQKLVLPALKESSREI